MGVINPPSATPVVPVLVQASPFATGVSETPAPGTPQAVIVPPVGTFTQEDVNRIVSERLERERGTQETAARKALEDAAAAALAEQGKWQELSERRLQEITDLKVQATAAESVTKERDAYKDVLNTLLETERKNLPDYITEALEGRNPVEQLAYIAKHRDKINGASAASGNGAPDIGARQGANPSAPDQESKIEKALAELRGSGVPRL